MAKRDCVFVTGASGFIGSRIVEHLRRNDYGVFALVRHDSHHFNPAVEVVVGDLASPETYAAALKRATAVVHAALTDDRTADVQITSNLKRAAGQAGIQNFIHLSSIAVYGNPKEGLVTEETPPLETPDSYSRMKLAVEELLREDSLIPQVSVLRLGCVYGKGGGWWTDGLLDLMQRRKLILVEGGSGTANLIHVEDVAATIPALLERSSAGFDVYNLIDGMPMPWNHYFKELEGVLGRGATVSMQVEEAKAYAKKWLQPSLAQRAARKLMRRETIHPLDENAIHWYASRAVYSNSKARAELNFKPMYSMPEGIRKP